MEFTYRSLLALKPTPGKTEEHFATGSNEKTPGLAVRVAPTGRKTFTFHYTFASKRARMDLGTFPAFGLDDARNRALDARRALESEPPRDPRDVRREEKAAAGGELTVADVVKLYLDDPDVKKLRSYARIVATLRTQFVEFIGKTTIAALTTRQLAACIDLIRKRDAACYAARAHKTMRLCFAWAVGQGHMATNPMLLVARPAEPEERGQKVRPLDDEGEIAAFWHGIRDALPEWCRDAYSRILKLALLTGCRISEVAEIQPGEIADGVLTIPPARTKNKKPHAIPLNAAMLEILGNDLDNPWGMVNDSPVNGIRLSQTFSKHDISADLGSVKGYTIHGLRRTFATGLDQMDIDPATISLCLNHSKKRKDRDEDEGAAVTKRYIMPSAKTKKSRAEKNLELKREAFDKWTAAVLELVNCDAMHCDASQAA